MARRVFWHIGLPKTGTTYLQDVLWSNREGQLRRSGLLLPGTGHREHLGAALEVQEKDLQRRDPLGPRGMPEPAVSGRSRPTDRRRPADPP